MINHAALRRSAGMTQVQLAAHLGVRQAQVSKIERQADMLISTLSSYLAALGVQAKIVVEVSDQTETYDLTQGREAR